MRLIASQFGQTRYNDSFIANLKLKN